MRKNGVMLFFLLFGGRESEQVLNIFLGGIFLKKAIVVVCFFIFLSIFIFVLKSCYKNFNFGNNIISNSEDSVVNNILNMKSYEADVTIRVVSNKNENTYRMVQQNVENEAYKQIVKEPAVIDGMEIVFRENKLEIKNTRLNLSKIYENYQYIANNELILTSFVKDYSGENETSVREDGGQFVMEVKLKNESNKYAKYKTLYVDKKTGKPSKMEIKDVSQNVVVYILYNEIKINGLQEIV